MVTKRRAIFGRDRKWALGAIIFTAMVALFVTPALAGRGILDASSDPATPDPTVNLEQAEKLAPYHILLPDPSPQGSTLVRVDWLEDGGTFNIDLWWTLPGSSSFHIWESDIKSFANQGADPTVSSQYVQVGDATWAVSKGDWGSLPFNEICRKFDSGVSVCVGSVEGQDFVERVAASLT